MTEDPGLKISYREKKILTGDKKPMGQGTEEEEGEGRDGPFGVKSRPEGPGEVGKVLWEHLERQTGKRAKRGESGNAQIQKHQ